MSIEIFTAGRLTDPRGLAVPASIRYFVTQASTPELAWDSCKELRDAWVAACPGGDARRAFLGFARSCERDGDSWAVCPFDGDGQPLKC